MKTIDELVGEGVSGKRVFVRADLNVPLDGDTTITDDGRIRAAVPTIRKLTESGARVVVASHLGRPKGAPDPQFSLAPVAARLGELLGTRVAFAADTVGDSAKATVGGTADGGVTLLENLRFNPGETSKDDTERGAFADELARARGRVRGRRLRRRAPQARLRLRPAGPPPARRRVSDRHRGGGAAEAHPGRRAALRRGPWAAPRSPTSSVSSTICWARPTGC